MATKAGTELPAVWLFGHSSASEAGDDSPLFTTTALMPVTPAVTTYLPVGRLKRK
jgi:hypothetical protein